MSNSTPGDRWNPLLMPFEFMGLRPERANTAPTTRSEEALMLVALMAGLFLGFLFGGGLLGWLLSVGLAYGACVAMSAAISWRRERQS